MKKKDKNPETPVTEEEAPQTAEQPQNTGETAGEQPEEKEASIDEWRAALETAVKQRDEYLDQLRRSQADFQNFRRRNQTSRADGFADGVEEVIGAMLPAIDNLERAIAAGIKDVVFDRGGYIYTGRVAELAAGAREGGLNF